jgi:hypothetical protein
MSFGANIGVALLQHQAKLNFGNSFVYMKKGITFVN